MTKYSEIARVKSKLQSPEIETRLAAVTALKQLDCPESLDALKEAAKNPNENVRLAAITALGKTKNPTVVPVLVDALEDFDFQTQKQAIYGLGNFKNEMALSALLDTLSQSCDQVICHAIIYSLWRIGDNRAIPTLVDILQDDNKFRRGSATPVQEYATSIIGELSGKDQNQAVLVSLMEKLRASKTGALRSNILKGLIKLESRGKPLLFDFLNDEDWLVRRTAARALGVIGGNDSVSHLVNALNDADWMVRWGAVEGLREIGDPASLAALIRATSDPFERVRRDAARAIETLTSDNSKNVKTG